MAPTLSSRSTRPTIQDVARLAQTSTGTVSRVLNNHPAVAEATRQRVQQAIAKLGFQADEHAVWLSRQRWQTEK